MGWDFCENWKTKADVIADLTRPDYHGAGIRPIAIKPVAKGAWVVWETPTGRCIEFNLMERQKIAGAYCYGVKGMTEEMHPYYYDCPVEFLALAPVACAEWRERVRAYTPTPRKRPTWRYLTRDRELAKRAAAHVNDRLGKIVCSYSAGPDANGNFAVETDRLSRKRFAALLSGVE